MTDYYHKKTGGHGNHRGGPHPNRLPMSVGTQQRKLAAEVAAPAYRRPRGRTLAAAIDYNRYLDAQASRNPMMALGTQHVIGTRTGRRGPLVAGPARTKRPR